MKELLLTQGKVAQIDDADFESVSKFKWYAWKNKAGNWYAVRTAKSGGRQYLHRVLIPGAAMVDHQDGNGLNNRRYNLRPCTSRQNQCNQKAQVGASSKFKGVYWHRKAGKWMSRLHFQGKCHYLGLFINEEQAARAYDEAAKIHHKEFARLNFS